MFETIVNTANTLSKALGRPVKVAIYARCSPRPGMPSDPSDATYLSNSTRGQLEFLRDIVKSSNGTMVTSPEIEYYDDYVSGTLEKRPGLDRLMADAKRKKFDVLLVYKIDRLTRGGILDLLTNIKLLEENGIFFKSATEMVDTSTPMGRAFLMLCGLFASVERDMFMERSYHGRLQRARNGKFLGRPPFAYTLNKVTGKLEINPKESKTVELMFKYYCRHNSSTTKVCKLLNAKGYFKQSGGKWTSAEVAVYLSYSIYYGCWFFNRTVGGKKNKPKDKSNWIEVQFPPIISKELFEKTQMLKKERRLYSERNTKLTYLLRGKIYCECQSRMGCVGEKK